ncbi:helix-turn-helix domain-containing protein [uncultured Mitsuokella sp.]|uniref:helix-turn-helix domain-containing protein n=1 Tax=uncultured Mitsuokella sp. TaxID=453120 RepID=UPI002592F805|nr:helix-turn-helix transcriptional regulator [uncultured Mitsuokella sp.]
MNGMSITSERLQALRKARGYSQQDVANLIGVGRTTYLKYENGDNKPTRKINELARLFQVSTDYLLGNTDSPVAPDQAPTQSPAHPVVKGDPVSELFDNPEIRGLARRNFDKLTPEQIQKKTQRSLKLMRAIFDEEND